MVGGYINYHLYTIIIIIALHLFCIFIQASVHNEGANSTIPLLSYRLAVEQQVYYHTFLRTMFSARSGYVSWSFSLFSCALYLLKCLGSFYVLNFLHVHM